MDEQSNNRKRPKRIAYIGLNLLIMALVAVGLGWLAFTWLDVWTGHGEEVSVPDVRGRFYLTAADELRLGGFEVEIADSVYDSKSRPGYVVDQNPGPRAVVKPGRLIYLTINALSPKTVTLPRLTDISSRQARAILEGLGLSDIVEVPVVSEFKDLVTGVEFNGRPVSAGARVPVNARITLKVGTGLDALDELGDSLGATEPLHDTTDRYDLF